MAEGGNMNRELDIFPVGVRFSPKDAELIHFLKLKIKGLDSEVSFIPEIDICKWEPWKLPAFSVIKTGDPEWFFFCILHCKYSKGRRSNRTTAGGYWKPTGQDRDIKAARYGEVIGKKKTLVYHYGRSPAAVKTNWVIHEYRTDVAGVPAQMAYVLCRLKRKTEDCTGSNFPSPDEAEVVAADTAGIHENEVANTINMTPTSSGSSNIIGSTDPQDSPDSDSDIYQGLDFDGLEPLSSTSSYNSCSNGGGMDFQGGDDFFNFGDSFYYEHKTSQWSSAYISYDPSL